MPTGTTVSATAIFKASPFCRHALEKSTSRPVSSSRKSTPSHPTVSIMFCWTGSGGKMAPCTDGKEPAEDRRAQHNPYENLGGQRRLLPPTEQLPQATRQAEQNEKLHQEQKDVLLVNEMHHELP